ncbi:MAG: M56 family metallopeptidase [Planctomycetota bacterium]
MTWLLQLYPGDAWVALAGIVVLQVAAVVVLAWTLAVAVRRSPAARSGIWLGALVAVCLSPLVALGVQRSGITTFALPILDPVLASANAESVREGSVTPIKTPYLGAQLLVRLGMAARAWAPPGDVLRSLATVLGLVWLMGVGWLGVRLLAGWRSLQRLRWRLEELPHGRWVGIRAELRRLLGMRQAPIVATSGSVSSPFSFGLLRPVIVLPADLVRTLSERQLRDVLVHESAHIARGDLLTGLVERLLQVVLWPHPLLPILFCELTRAREELCDNFVLREGDAARYARTLLTISERAAGAPLVVSALGILDPWPRLEHRVAGLLDARRERTTRLSRGLLCLAGALSVVALIGIGGVRLVPRTVARETAHAAPQSDVVAHSTPSDKTTPLPSTTMRHVGEDAPPGAREQREQTDPSELRGQFAQQALRRTDPDLWNTVARGSVSRADAAGASVSSMSPSDAGPSSARRVPFRARLASAAARSTKRESVAPAEVDWATPPRPSGSANPRQAIPPIAAPDGVVIEVQPALFVERSELGYLVAVQIAEEEPFVVDCQPGKMQAVGYDIGLSAELVLEFSVEHSEQPQAAAVAYRIGLRPDSAAYSSPSPPARTVLKLDQWGVLPVTDVAAPMAAPSDEATSFPVSAWTSNGTSDTLHDAWQRLDRARQALGQRLAGE